MFFKILDKKENDKVIRILVAVVFVVLFFFKYFIDEIPFIHLHKLFRD